MFNTETGESFDLGNVSEMTIEPESETELCAEGTQSPFITGDFFKGTSITLDMEYCEVNPNFYEIIGCDVNKAPDSFNIQFAKPVQIRRHRKKRINKKWAKRYGYRYIIVESKDWKLKPNYEDGTFELVK